MSVAAFLLPLNQPRHHSFVSFILPAHRFEHACFDIQVFKFIPRSSDILFLPFVTSSCALAHTNGERETPFNFNYRPVDACHCFWSRLASLKIVKCLVTHQRHFQPIFHYANEFCNDFVWKRNETKGHAPRCRHIHIPSLLEADDGRARALLCRSKLVQSGR